jgi:stringent starvation protein B
MQPTRLPRKKDVAIALLEQASVFVHIDPRPEEVRVPPWFKRQAQLVLQIGLNMPVPIPDLDVSDHGLSCTLSFNRSPFHCQIPWPSVYALVGESGRGMVWPDDVPPEVAAQAQKQAKPQLAAVAAPAPEPKPEAEEATPAAKKKAAPRRTPAKARAAKTGKALAKPAKETKADEKGVKADAKVAKSGATKKRGVKASPARPAAQRAAAPPRAEPARRAAPAAAPQPAAAPEKVATLKAAGASSKGATGARKKRALPPYLRVVK